MYTEQRDTDEPNGAALAAFLAAGVGAFVLGVIVILNEAGVFTVPAVYDPAGGVSGRTTFGVLGWLIAWAVLHLRWRGTQLESGRVHTMALVLTVLGVLLCLPPVWRFV
jgi:multisubunit Na+/H+ antiporter MnhG subunit